MNVLLAFFYQWFTLTQLGPGRATDALFAGMVVPQLVLAVVSGSLTHVLVPLLTGQRDEAFARNAWTCFLGVGALFGGLAVVLFVGAPGWVPLTVPGFDSEARELTVELVRIQLLGMVFTAMTGVLWSAFQARQRFLWVESSPIIAFLIGFPILLLGLPRFGVAAAAWALVAKAVVQWLFLLPVIGRYRKPDFRSDFANAAWRRVRPLLIGSSYARTEQLVDRALASLAAPGALSLFFLAQQLYGAGHQVLNSAVSAPLVPRLSQRFAAGDETGFAQLRRSRLQGIAAFTVAVFLAVVLAGQPVLELLFGHGRFSIRPDPGAVVADARAGRDVGRRRRRTDPRLELLRTGQHHHSH